MQNEDEEPAPKSATSGSMKPPRPPIRTAVGLDSGGDEPDKHALQSVRVIGKTGSQLGIMTLSAAWSMAESEQADLILIAPSVRPPVYRVMDCQTKQKPKPSDKD